MSSQQHGLKMHKCIESMDVLHVLVDCVADTDVPIINKAENEIRNLDQIASELSHHEQALLLVSSLDEMLYAHFSF
jgi:hypothetical protein